MEVLFLYHFFPPPKKVVRISRHALLLDKDCSMSTLKKSIIYFLSYSITY